MLRRVGWDDDNWPLCLLFSVACFMVRYVGRELSPFVAREGLPGLGAQVSEGIADRRCAP